MNDKLLVSVVFLVACAGSFSAGRRTATVPEETQKAADNWNRQKKWAEEVRLRAERERAVDHYAEQRKWPLLIVGTSEPKKGQCIDVFAPPLAMPWVLMTYEPPTRANRPPTVSGDGATVFIPDGARWQPCKNFP